MEHETQYGQSLDALAARVKDKTPLRLTIIAKSGLVIAESHRDRQDMNNHARREEIIQSKNENFGVSIRFSNSLKSDFLYVAKKVELPNQSAYIRFSISLKTVLEDFYTIWLQITLIFSLMVSMGFLIALRMSRRIENDVSRLTDYLDAVEKKIYTKPLSLRTSLEFTHIANSLKSVVAKLDKREKQRRKTVAKFRLMYKQQNDLLSAVSHEFKNPLAAISGYAQTIIEELPAEGHKMHHKFLTKIEQNSQKITSMLDRIALSVKLENNDLVAQKSSFDLGEVIEDAISVIEKKHPNRTINYKYHKQMVEMDITMIEMVLINLLDNALKYSQEDIKIRMSNKRVFVIDKGIGMSEADCEKVQSKFYRVDANSWDNSMGLGLAIVSYILKLHHCELTIQSKLGAGSTFSFKFTN